MNRVYQLSNVSNIHNKGIYGQGITVAILDSGTSPHPDFIYPENRIIGWYDVINGKPQPYDDNGHGTHVAGIIASNGMASQGKIMGMAPKVKIVSVKVLDHKGDGNSKDVIEGLQWVLQNKERYNIRIVNISVGTPIGKEQGENSELVQMVNRIWDAGIIVVAAAGNNGPEPGSVGAPGNSRKVITVGAIEEPGGIMRHGEMVRDYSGRGPTRECIKKPDVVSWGNQILSCRNFTGMRGRFSERTISNSSLNRYYTRKNGRSEERRVGKEC